MLYSTQFKMSSYSFKAKVIKSTLFFSLDKTPPQRPNFNRTTISIRFVSNLVLSDTRSAFTYMKAKDAPKSRRITFSIETVNIGGNYDTSTGLFTCVLPGIYVFILHVYKTRSADYATCYITKNGQIQVVADINPDPDSNDGKRININFSLSIVLNEGIHGQSMRIV